MFLLSEIGPAGDLSVEMLLNSFQPPGLRVNENRMPFSVTVSLAAHINDAAGAHAAATRECRATPTRTAFGEEPGCAEAEAVDEGETRVTPTSATIVAAATGATRMACRAFIFRTSLRLDLLACRIR